MKHTTLITLILALIVSASVAQVHMHIDSLTFKGSKEIKITKVRFLNAVKSNSSEIGRIKKPHNPFVIINANKYGWLGTNKPKKKKAADNNLRHFMANVEFQTLDNCQHSASVEFNSVNNGPVTYEFIYNDIKNWIKPEKIKKWSLVITKLQQVKDESGFRHKSEKFKPCQLDTINHGFVGEFAVSGTTIPDPDFVSNNYYFIRIHGAEVVSISSADSTGVTTVKFSRSQVHFINDSTFTFKEN